VAGLLVVAFALGCGGASNSEKAPGGGGSPGSPGSPGSGGSPGNGGSPGSGGSAATGGSPGAGGSGGAGSTPDAGMTQTDGPPAGACPPQTSLNLAVHIIMDASWPATNAADAGKGKIHLWNLSKLNASGTELSGDQTRSCGTILPEFALNFAGQTVAGGKKVQVEIPHDVWEAPSIPRLHSQGKISGWSPGSMFSIDGTVALMGLTMPDASAAWPKSYTAIMAVDADGDGHPGFTAVPRKGGDYVQPPTGLGLFGSAPTAEKLYLSSRTVVSLKGMLTSCTDVAGPATISFFDSHVVGCFTNKGAECTPNQIDFVDQGRTLYKIEGATFVAKKVSDTATCAEARAAVPVL
jgi:hypothetical protein